MTKQEKETFLSRDERALCARCGHESLYHTADVCHFAISRENKVTFCNCEERKKKEKAKRRCTLLLEDKGDPVSGDVKEIAEYERWKNEVQETLNRRYDEAQSGKVQWISGDEVRENLRIHREERSKELETSKEEAA
jgi:hypothetical protein